MRPRVMYTVLLPLGLTLGTAAFAGERPVDPKVADKIEKLKSLEAQERYSAALALGEMGEKSRPAVPHLLALLDDLEIISRDTGESVADYAIWALGQIGDARAYAPLMEVIEDPETTLQPSAVRAVLNLRPVWKKLIHQRGIVPSELEKAVPSLIAASQSSRPEVRRAAALALAAMPSLKAVPALISLLEDDLRREIAEKALANLISAAPRLFPVLVMVQHASDVAVIDPEVCLEIA